MGVIRVPQDYVVRRHGEAVREAFQSIGEEIIFLRMRHATIDGSDEINLDPRCSRCWDEDYKQASDEFCPNCFGTTFDKPVQRYGRAWALFSDNTSSRELLRKWGEWQTDDREVQIENAIEADEHDYLVRVRQWSRDHRPVQMQGRYRIDSTMGVSLRTGNRLGLDDYDMIGTTLKAHYISSQHPLMKFPIDPNTPVPRYTEV